MNEEKKFLRIVKPILENENRVNDEGAAEILGISKKTLFNKVSNGKFADLYTISPVNGKRFWFKDKLMGSA